MIPGLLNVLEIYDPTTKTWSEGAADAGGGKCAAVAVIGDKMYMVGTFGAGQAGVLVYNADTNTWSTGPSLEVGRQGLACGGRIRRQGRRFECGRRVHNAGAAAVDAGDA